MKRDFSPSRRAWNIALTAAVWAAAVLVIALTAGVIGLVLIRGIPHISWNFLSTTASVLKGTDGILPAILNTLYVIFLSHEKRTDIFGEQKNRRVIGIGFRSDKYRAGHTVFRRAGTDFSSGRIFSAPKVIVAETTAGSDYLS